MDLTSQFAGVLVEHRYSYRTVKTYRNIINDFLHVSGCFAKTDLSVEKAECYLRQKFESRMYSAAYQRHTKAALKFFFEKVLLVAFPTLPAASQSRIEKSPAVLSIQEIDALLAASDNLKYRTFFAVMYGAGLTLSEATELRPADISPKKKAIIVSDGALGKQRESMLPTALLDLIRTYYGTFKPKNWLFEGKNGRQISHRALQAAFKKAVYKAGVNKPVTLFALRHSFAVHLLEQGTDIKIIQNMLGHKSASITNKYKSVAEMSVAKVNSPFELLNYGRE
jgi:integrase/recombinase XerD